VTAAGRAQRDGLSIGAVLAQLRGDFPDVTISKIRFLESEGLVRPGRTPSGYRQFTAADVERLRFVLAAQRDHYLPLKVIKEQLETADRGIEISGVLGKAPRKLVSVDSDTVPAPVTGVPQAEDFAESQEFRLTQEELLSQASIDMVMLGELQQYGLIKPGPAGFYDLDAVAIARTVKSMTEFGIEPRHLRAFRASADREVGLIEQIVAPVLRHRDAEASARADEMIRELAVLSVALRTLLVKAGIKGMPRG
jgi:DNA-binding transcriptional MerR regulator